MVFSTSAPRERVRFGSVTMNRRSICMLKEAERIGGFKLRLVQGSYTDGVKASAGTHSGGGAMDVSVRGLTQAQIAHRVRSLRKAGWAAWYRTAPPFSGPHIHAIAVGDPELAEIAARQVADYKQGRNGLKGHGPDNGPRVDPRFYSPAVLARYVTKAGRVYADATILAFVSRRFEKRRTEFSSGKSRPHIEHVQRALKEVGLYPFEIDGKWGPKTHQGYANWRKRLGVKDANGVVSPASLDALGRKTGNFRVKSSKAGKRTAPPFPGTDAFGPGKVNDHVTRLGRQLIRLGFDEFYKVGPGPRWSDADRNAVRAFQQSRAELRNDADGFPGKETWRLAHELPTRR
ncbi:peptidoglycan-binding protein [Streptomyces sp. NPDC051940]|uniref:peptidoglycan-binding protein n=1 Tax=Streptomyces sp. NPDC051940 TaxID=3155675 RepID=UPI00341B1E15